MTSPIELSDLDVGRVLQALALAGDQAGVGFAVTDVSEEPRVIYVSEGVSRMTGRSAEALLSGSIFECIAPEEADRVRELLQERRRSTESKAVETVLLTPDGRRVQVEMGTTGLAFEGRRLAVTILRDASDRIKSELALTQSEQRFRALVENGPDGVVILRGVTVVYMSPRAAALLDLKSPQEAIGKPILQFLDPTEAARTRARLAEMGARQSRLEPTVYSFHSADGFTRYVEISSVPAEYEGQPAVIGFARDVTERKQLDAQLVKADRMAALGMLSATVAHEINNPLTYVQLGLEELRAELAAHPLLGADSHGFLSQIAELEGGVRRAASIVKDLRVFARTEELVLGSVDVEQVLEQAIRIADGEIRYRARLVRDFARVPRVHANAASLEHVFLNLLVNAGQAIAPGAPDENSIMVSLQKHGESQICVEISDTGSGIPAAVLPKIFEPLFTTKPPGVGTGLGLSICRSLLMAQGGEIRVESVEGRGTKIAVLLPKFEGPEVVAAAVAQPAAPPPQTSSITVWVIDDEPMIGKLIAQLLADEHEVRATTLVSAVVEWLSSGERPDVILCDLTMPGQGGSDLFAILKERWPGLEKRMLIMTGGAFTSEQTDFLAGLEVPALTKPFDLSELRRLILKLANPTPAS
ncbi:MAG: PAS domain S-box protein [Polyangiaceae bacterium]|nr:PAS domain S-box protein [Polyangiaceae bacterium]